MVRQLLENRCQRASTWPTNCSTRIRKLRPRRTFAARCPQRGLEAQLAVFKGTAGSLRLQLYCFFQPFLHYTNNLHDATTYKLHAHRTAQDTALVQVRRSKQPAAKPGRKQDAARSSHLAPATSPSRPAPLAPNTPSTFQRTRAAPEPTQQKPTHPWYAPVEDSTADKHELATAKRSCTNSASHPNPLFPWAPQGTSRAPHKRPTSGTATFPRSLPQGHLPGTPPRDTSLGHLPGTPPRDITPRHLPRTPPWGTSLGHLPGTPPRDTSLGLTQRIRRRDRKESFPQLPPWATPSRAGAIPIEI